MRSSDDAREFDILIEHADDAWKNAEMWTAALLFQQALELARLNGWGDWVSWTLRAAANCWMGSAEPDRGLSLLLDALAHPHKDQRPSDLYWLHSSYVNYAVFMGMDLGDLDRQIDRLSMLAQDIWGDPGSHSVFRKGEMLLFRGDWSGALAAFELAWTNKEAPGPQTYDPRLASQACKASLRLAREPEARQWVALIGDDDVAASCYAAARRVDVAVHGNDAETARSASKALDGLLPPQRPPYMAAGTLLAVKALLVDPGGGDPADPNHLARLRLNHQTNAAARDFDLRYSWDHMLASVELAGLRYAAGMSPVDDVYYRKSQTLTASHDARLPTEIRGRVSSFRQACDTASLEATQTDAYFGSSWRQQEVTELRQRGEDVAAVFLS